METNRICPNCRKPLQTDVPLGLCPECLIRSGFPTGTAPGAAEAAGARFVPPPVEEIARLFPQLEILGLIGKGGMGAVYRARQPALDRFVALKVLPPAAASDPGFAERFNREARALAQLNHPNIVAVHDFGKAGGLHFLVMEFVDGTNLREVERAGRLAPEQALAIVPQICEALQFAHNEGVVHRDIKPENILLDKKGRVKITDFGIAKIVGVDTGQAALTGARDVIGTPHYMAPEQVEKPQTVDHRADIYSLGVVFYELLTGELPLGKFAPPSARASIDVRLDEVVLRTLEKEPERRYQHVSQVKTAVETIAGSAPGPGVRSPEAEFEAARRQVQGPAVGLIITGILNWLAVASVAASLGLLLELGRRGVDLDGPLPEIVRLMTNPDFGSLQSAVVTVIVAGFAFSSFIIYAGLKLRRLERRGAAMLGSVLAMLVSPGNLIGLPIAIWALVVLARPEVKQAMAVPRRAPGASASPARRTRLVDVALVVLAAGVAARLAFEPLLQMPERSPGVIPFEPGLQIMKQLRSAESIRWEDLRIESRANRQGYNAIWRFAGLRRLAGGPAPGQVAQDLPEGALRIASTGWDRWHVSGSGGLAFFQLEVDRNPSRDTAPIQAQGGVGPVVERIISRDDADERGFVFFDLESGLHVPPPFPLSFQSNRSPAFVELTSELRQWILVNRVDVLIHFEADTWSAMNLRMQENFVAGPAELERVTSRMVAEVFARIDAVSRVRDEVPASGLGRSFNNRVDNCKAFRTRSNTTGVMQWVGLSTTPRRVGIRYRLVQPAGAPAATYPGPSTNPPAASLAGPGLEKDPVAVISETIRGAVRRDLEQIGARIDGLEVAAAGTGESATPFKVRYRGLRGFDWGGGETVPADGEFSMRYGGAGKWQGALGGVQFTVPVARTDDFTLPFVNDPQVLGEWESVDFVADVADFRPRERNWTGELQFKALTFLAGGQTRQPWWTWSRGVLIHQEDRTTSHYEIREIEGQPYLFLEWKSGDVTISGMKPKYYVLKKKP